MGYFDPISDNFFSSDKKINNFRGDLRDISAKTATLATMHCWRAVDGVCIATFGHFEAINRFWGDLDNVSAITLLHFWRAVEFFRRNIS